MSTLPHTRCHAPQRQLGGLEPQEHNFNTISRFSPGLESPHVGQPAQRALEGKVRPRLREPINLPQYRAGSCNGRQSRFQRREARGLRPDLDDLVQGFASAPVRILRHLLERMRHCISGPPIK
jgi:hypothetical protein